MIEYEVEYNLVKWADYLISAVSYNEDHTKIVKVRQHEDKNGKISNPVEIGRAEVASNIKNGKRYVTIYSGPHDTWRLGKKVNAFRVNGEYCIRVDQNKVNLDNLGDIVEF